MKTQIRILFESKIYYVQLKFDFIIRSEQGKNIRQDGIRMLWIQK